jgi:two-component system NtrC family sensor kinase
MLGNIFARHFHDLHADDEIIDPVLYARLKRKIVVLMAVVTIAPLLLMTAINITEYHGAMDREAQGPLRVLVGKAKNSLELFLAERVSTLAFIAQAYSFQDLSDEKTLQRIFRVMRKEFEGFVDLSVIDDQGVVRGYAGPYDFKGRNYSGQDWFAQVQANGRYISDVFLGFRNVPHFVVAVQHYAETGEVWVLRATLDSRQLEKFMAAMGLEPGSEGFLVNRQGVLQSSSTAFGGILEKCPLALPPVSYEANVVSGTDPSGRGIYLAYAYLADSDYVLMAVKPKGGVLSMWYNVRGDLLFVLVAGVAAIFYVVSKSTGLLLGRMRDSEERRSQAFRQMEHAQKLSSIGRLAAGVAHEINNPMAIINEKAGLMKDLLALNPDFPDKARFLAQVESILKTVDRCRGITQRMLGFARRMDVKIEDLSLNEVLSETAGFLASEAEHRHIALNMYLDQNLKRIESDRGQLQQVALNIMNNALAAVPDGGCVDVRSWNQGQDQVGFSIQDNGCGMSSDTIKCIFEPFFTTKGNKGTGLGLSITYGIVKRLGGDVNVRSQEREGTTFTVSLPVTAPSSSVVEVS